MGMNLYKYGDNRWINLDQITYIRKILPGEPDPHSLRSAKRYMYYTTTSNGEEVMIFSTPDKLKALEFEKKIGLSKDIDPENDQND